jgi:hypothetical protein
MGLSKSVRFRLPIIIYLIKDTFEAIGMPKQGGQRTS